ncbi:MAG TPA: aminotransferase [Acidimicrobiia bacterium]|nr:aminotransferase [Acidimicrobiia bacterium]
MTYRHLFSRFLDSHPERLHFAAHSHHPWPDVTYDAHQRWWEDSAQGMDDKWEGFFADFIPRLRGRLGRLLNLGDGATIAFAPNTHELVNRVFSTLPTPVEIVTTTAEFHSFDRQVRRWEEAGWAKVTRIGAEPFASFPERFLDRSGRADLVYLSQVFFDSGFVVPDLAALIDSLPNSPTVIIDGYHGFMARPQDLAPLAHRAFFVAGGYKYAMAGEGAAFMHCPPGKGERPVDTGWYAGFGALTDRVDEVSYGANGDRFWGATQDGSGLYRLEAALEMFEANGITPQVIQGHVAALQEDFLDRGPALGELLPPSEFERGSFLTFRRRDANDLYRRLHNRRVITDYRGDRFRIGFGIYHEPEDVYRLVSELQTIESQI